MCDEMFLLKDADRFFSFTLIGFLALKVYATNHILSIYSKGYFAILSIVGSNKA